MSRALFVAVGALGLVGLLPGIAGAHIEPDPSEAPAASRQSIGFTVEHGCDGSPTTSLSMRLPEGVTDAVPEAPEGWTGTVEGDVVSFAGGPLDPETEGTFRVLMSLPDTAGATLYFPFVQTCEAGEIRWIDVPEDGSGAESDEPAPALLLTAADPAAPSTSLPTTTAVVTTVPPTTVPGTVPATTAPGPPASDDQTGTGEPGTSSDDPLDTSAPESSVTGDANDDDGSSLGVVLGIVAAVAVAVAGGAVYLTRRR